MLQLLPMWRFTERIVRSGLVMAWRLATSPTSTSPFLAKATTEGVVLAPSALGITTGSPPSRTETTELVVPRSMPTALGMGVLLDGGTWVPRNPRSVALRPPGSRPPYVLDLRPTIKAECVVINLTGPAF